MFTQPAPTKPHPSPLACLHLALESSFASSVTPLYHLFLARNLGFQISFHLFSACSWVTLACGQLALQDTSLAEKDELSQRNPLWRSQNELTLSSSDPTPGTLLALFGHWALLWAPAPPGLSLLPHLAAFPLNNQLFQHYSAHLALSQLIILAEWFVKRRERENNICIVIKFPEWFLWLSGT